MVNQEALLRLKKSRPWDYAKNCEELGDYEEAIAYYSESHKYDVIHAAEIAMRISDYDRAKEFIKKAKMMVKKDEDDSKDAEKNARHDSGINGDFQMRENEKKERKEFREKIGELEGSLIEVGQL